MSVSTTTSDFSQWLHAMKMVARLPGGIPPEFRKKVLYKICMIKLGNLWLKKIRSLTAAGSDRSDKLKKKNDFLLNVSLSLSVPIDKQ